MDFIVFSLFFNSSIEEIMKTNDLLLTKVKDGLTSSTEMETRASQMKLKVSNSLEKANTTYSEKQDKIIIYPLCGKIQGDYPKEYEIKDIGSDKNE